MTTSTDSELFAAIARGDPDAVGGLYDRHASIVFALALHVVGDRARAEELVHDTFLALVRAAQAGLPVRHVLRWLIVKVVELAR